MKIDDTIRNEKLQYNIHREADFQQIKLINVNILQMQKYYILIKIEFQSKLGLCILFSEKLQEYKQREFKIQLKSKHKRLKIERKNKS